MRIELQSSSTAITRKMTVSLKINEPQNGLLKSENHSQESKIGRILSNLSKLAIDSTFNDSLKGLTGPRKLYKIVQERFRYPPTSIPLSHCKKPDDEVMRAKLEEMIEDMAKLKQLNETSANCVGGRETLDKGPNEGGKKLGVLEPEKKRVFIRSRL